MQGCSKLVFQRFDRFAHSARPGHALKKNSSHGMAAVPLPTRRNWTERYVYGVEQG